ncbi:MAG: hypothetical protein AAFX54_00030 [Pseudomonadota bacterium]
MPKAKSPTKFFQWLRDGLGIILPKSIAHSGWKTTSLQIRTNGSGEKSAYAIEQSRLGAKRLAKAPPDDERLPVEAVLAPDKLFTTTVSLPMVAAKSLKGTIELRLADISPLPPENVAFAVSKKVRYADDRLEADVAITRKSTLFEIRESLGNERITSIGAEPDKNGALKFIFDQRVQNQQSGKKAFVSAALLFGAVSLLFVSIDAKLKIEGHDLENYERSVLAELRAVRELTSFFDDIEASTLAEYSGSDSKLVLHDVQSVLAPLPEGVLVDKLYYRRGTIELSGFASSSIEQTSEIKSLTVEPSGMPGLNQFKVRINSGDTP